MGAVVVVPYDPEWPRTFETIRERVWRVMSDVAISIEHVGSTSVPGLSAKPVVDLDVIVPDDCLPIGIERLASIGYVHRGEMGIPKREAFRSPSDLPRHHLYLCPESSPALMQHLAIRDYLRQYPDAATAYGDLKQSLARQYANDVDAYIEGKTPFLTTILRTVGVSETQVAEIVRMNRKRPD